MRKFLLTLMLSFTLSLGANDNLVVEQSSGETVWTISTIKDVTFDGNGASINFQDGSSVYYAKESLIKLKFKSGGQSSVAGINSENSSISIVNDVITATAADDGIQVFALNGAVVAQSNGNQLNIAHLTQGAYIVKAGSLISKIIKR